MKLLTSTRTKFFYGISVIEIDRVPFLERSLGEDLLRMVYHTGEGKADTSLEFLRIAGEEPEGQIRHFFIFRTMDADAASCCTKAQRLYRAVYHFLTDNGYHCREIDYEEFHVLYAKLPRDQARYLCRDIHRDHAGMLCIPCIGQVDMSAIYAALNGSTGCALSLHMTPSKMTSAEYGYLHSMSRVYRNRSSDPARLKALTLLEQRCAMIHTFNITMCVSGNRVDEISSRLAAAMGIPAITLPVNSDAWSFPEQPWIRNKAVDEQLYGRCKSSLGMGNPPRFCGLFTKFIPAEAAQLLALPAAGKGYVGIKSNIFSLLSRSAVWDEKLTTGGVNSLVLGISPKGQPLYLPMNELTRGFGIFGMNGTGKSVWLLSTIQQLQKKECKTLVLAGAKYEMRKLIKQFRCRLHTPGVRDISPMKINIFEVPEGSTVARHKSAVVTTLGSAVDMPSPLDSLLFCALDETYKRFGYRADSSWKDGTAFSLHDFIPIYKQMLADSEYGREVKGNLTAAAYFRLLALLERADGMLDTLQSPDAKELLESNLSVVELEGLEPCDRKLAAFLILTSVMAYIRTLPEANGKIRMALVIDETHALLANGGERPDSTVQLAGLAVHNLMVEMISTMRSRGIGLIYSDQSVHRLGGNILFDQTVNKLLFRLEGQENHLASHALHFTHQEEKCLLNLGVGQALFKSDLDMEAIGIHTIFKNYGENVSDAELRNLTVREASKVQASPAEITAGLLSRGEFPNSVELFQVWNVLDAQTGRAVAKDLERRANARGIQIPQEYAEVVHRYFSIKQRE